MMTPGEIRDAASEIIDKAEFAVLSTVDDAGFPEPRAMLNLKAGGLNPLFTTNTSSRKIPQIEANSKGAAFFGANREWKGVTLVGTLEIVADAETKAALWQPSWTMYYPGGLGDPDYSVLRLRTKRIVLYYAMTKAILEL